MVSLNRICLFLNSIYLFKVDNRNTRTICEVCSKLKIKTPERRLSTPERCHWHMWNLFRVNNEETGFFTVNLKQILHIVLMFLLLLWISKFQLNWNHNQNTPRQKFSPDICLMQEIFVKQKLKSFFYYSTLRQK